MKNSKLKIENQGFTLIEMLIVIAVIGVLAVAVLSAINPIEQMRKARDTRRRSNAAELLNALERYYATNEAYPTEYGAVDGTTCLEALTHQIGPTDLGTLVTENELKAEFSDRITDAADLLYGAVDVGGSDLAIVCYEIESSVNKSKYSGANNWCTDADGEYVCLPE